MEYFAGEHWIDGEAQEGWVAVEGRRLVEEGHGRAPKSAKPAVILEGVHNFHTHIGDAFLRGEQLPRNLAQLVAPGTGLKSRRLATASSQTVVAGMRRHLQACAEAGVDSLVDFREQGAAGVTMAREAATGSPIEVFALGRPNDVPPDPVEVDEILGVADGLGVPSVADWGLETCANLAETAHRRGRAFALHASEGEREPLEDVLGLHPDLLVHLGAATRADLRLVADAGVPVAVCPSSNEFFEVPCAADRLASVGVSWYLGTDNAMLGAVDPVDEARRLRGRHPELEDAELLRALSTHPRTAIPALDRTQRKTGRARRLRILPLNASGAVQWAAPTLVVERGP